MPTREMQSPSTFFIRTQCSLSWRNVSISQVTMIKNLEVYGVDPMAVSLALQHRVHASSALNYIPGSKDRALVEIQGNRVQQVGQLLLLPEP
ncbi:eukaryotic translation initiation factor 2D-like [Oncorhynchus masou masou]|uniref:eukaryotic translation initiation factor 2D-like n=1 Tax=Oncorhynchus masou masou TaxID=90313 RepID=UPI003183DC37